jgi:hypothetical protein
MGISSCMILEFNSFATAPLIPENKTGPNSQGMTERPGEFSNLAQQ